MFKRRDRQPWWQAGARFLWPRGGWARAFEYVGHRLRRLPDPPEKIGRGIAAGVFTSFTPLYGFHFLLAALIGKMIRGNILASILGTFFGNPLTYVPIAVAALKTGHFILDEGHPGPRHREGVGEQFAHAWRDLWHNFKAIFTDARADWDGLEKFYHDLFFPYLVGGIIPGIIAAAVCYFLSVPVIRAYQKRRRKMLMAKRNKLREENQNGQAATGREY